MIVIIVIVSSNIDINDSKEIKDRNQNINICKDDNNLLHRVHFLLLCQGSKTAATAAAAFK